VLNTDQDENKKMKPINPLDLMPQDMWNHISTSIACNVPDEYGATDKGMVDLLQRASVDMDTIKKKTPSLQN